MALYPNPTPEPTYPNVPLFEIGRPVDGGINGEDNKGLIALAERTDYLYKNGFYEHMSDYTYPQGSFCQVGGVLYKAKTTNVDKPPATSTADWEKCGITLSELQGLLGLGSGIPVSYGEQTTTAEQRNQALANLGLLDLVKNSDHKNSAVAVITSSSVALSGIPAAANADGVMLAAGDRVLRAVSPADAANGLYVVQAGAWTRATDANESAEVTAEMSVNVEQGNNYSSSTWTLVTESSIVLGTTPLLFVNRAASAAGEICYFAGSTAPAGFLKANGAAVSRASYASLFAYIGTKFGVGNGSTTFNLPDLRGEFVRCFDDGRGIDLGRELGSSQDATSVPSRVSRSDSTSTQGAIDILNGDGAFQQYSLIIADNPGQATAGTNAGAYYMRPRNVSLLACIRY